MSSFAHADHSAAQPPDRDTLDALITQARTLRGGLDAVRRGAGGSGPEAGLRAASAVEQGIGEADLRARWQRALCELAVHQLDDLGGQLDQLREGLPPTAPDAGVQGPGAPAGGPTRRNLPPDDLPPEDLPPDDPPPHRAPARGLPSHGLPSRGHPPHDLPGDSAGAAYGTLATPRRNAASELVGRVGSADWNLLTDAISWSPELYRIFGRTEEDGPLSLDELPSWVVPEEQPGLATAFTDCLVDGRAIDHEFRLVRPDGSVRTVHLVGEPVLDDDGATASMWAVVRDVSALRRSERAVRETRDSLQRETHLAQTERRLAVELQRAVLPPWRGSPRFPQGDTRTGGALDLAAHYLPSATSALIGGDWYDALGLPDGATLLTVGDLTGHGVAATSGVAMLLGAVRGMGVAGVGPGPLMGHLNQLLDSAAQPSLGSALCCHYTPRTRSLTWSQAGHPPPLLIRGGVGQVLPRSEGVLLGVTSGARYGQRTAQLAPGDLLVLHTDGLAPRGGRPAAAGQEGGPPAGAPHAGAAHAGAARLLAVAGRLASASSAQECVRMIAEEFDDRTREDDACVLVARVTP
ncbi:PP2C family protein-serine/threonine phosphatase [Streptomyces reniochalinae]|uniref:PAS domain S-box protein n=1 Tax=Streptomyces reniochalinae TaxID=2250578 RepID=A0A367ESL6_9ACTN|nr:SpoIIE family protein phosphatase [Streptomyces reniochalinae]RCG21084.1 PAS domain S-box protein [Streptomyces reniochalinae]